MRSPRRGMCAAILALESIVLGLSTPVMITLADVPVAVALAVGLGLALLCLLLAGALRGEGAYRLGWGFVVPLMFFLGAVFALLWGTADWLGRKIERERAAAYARVAEGDPGLEPGPDPAASSED